MVLTPSPVHIVPAPNGGRDDGDGQEEVPLVFVEAAPPEPESVGEVVEGIVQAGSGRVLRIPTARRDTPAGRPGRLGLPIESTPASGPLEWDGDSESPIRHYEAARREREARELRRSRSERRQTRRHPQLDDYEPRHLQRARSITPPGPPIRDRSPAQCAAPTARPPAAIEAPPRPVRARGAQFGDLVRVPTNPTIDPPPYSCFNCWQWGHSRLRCPRPSVAMFCYNCGRRGVTLRTCPRCELPHRLHMEGRAAALRMGPPPRREERPEEDRSRRAVEPAEREARAAGPAEGIVTETLRSVGEM